MAETQLLVNTESDFATKTEVLTHLNKFLGQHGFVKPSYLQAICEREESYPTGIDFGFGAIAIPHCDASHAIKPCIYVIKPKNRVTFNQADDDGTVEAEMIIALVVTDPKEQMKLLKALFTSLQDEHIFKTLKNSKSSAEISDIFHQYVFKN